MLGTETTTETWLDSLLESMSELAVSMMGWEEVSKNEQSTFENPAGTTLALVSDEVIAEVGISTSWEGCEELARGLLCMPKEDGDLEDDEIVDSFGEVINIVGGMVKQKLSDSYENMKLGLPVVLRGVFEHPHVGGYAETGCIIGKTPVKLFVQTRRLEESK